MEIIPLNGFVVIQEAEDIVSKGRSVIILTEGADVEPKNQGKIIRMPTVDEFSPMSQFKEGDLVIFKRHMFDDLAETLQDKNYKGLVLGKQDNVIAIIKPK